jgi:hypothetical protein
MYNICLNIRLKILLKITYRIIHYILLIILWNNIFDLNTYNIFIIILNKIKIDKEYTLSLNYIYKPMVMYNAIFSNELYF